MRSLLLTACLLAAVLLVIIVLHKIKKNRINDYYDTENRYEILFSMDRETDDLTPFASELAVISEESNDAGFKPDAGLLATVGKPYTSFNKNATKKVDPASTTKIMTAVIALKYGELTDYVTVTEEAMVHEYGASLANIEPGQTISLQQLLYGLLLPSGNDAANAIAIHIAGSKSAFVDMMNKEAAELGAVDSHFSNAHGMTEEDHYTTVYDLYLITNEALKYPEFRRICATRQYIAEFLDPQGLAVSRTWQNTNKYVSGDRELPPGFTVTGGKTGTTMAAGNCLVLATKDEKEREIISIVMKADSKDSLYAGMDHLLGKVD